MPEKKYKLLVVDDHKLFIEGLNYILKNELSCEVADFALNGKEAIEKCRRGDFDILLMDINMPLIDGHHATREIRQFNSKIKIIILSMLADLPSVVKSLDAGADAYVLKDSGTEELLKAIKSVFKGEIFLSSSIAQYFDRDNKRRPVSKKEHITFSESLITPREKAILKLISEGLTNKQIAELLFISEKTTETHRKNMLAKLNQPNTASLVKFAIDNKLI